MRRTHQTNDLDQALVVLEEAAKEKSDELKNLIGKKYHRVRDMLQEGPRFRAEELLSAGEKKMEEMVQKGQTAATKMIEEVDKKMHENPLPFVGGALLLGFLLANNNRGNGHSQ